MNKDLKVAFFGTSDKSDSILEVLKENFDLRLCVTKADTLVGRHQDVRETGVKIWADQNEVPFIEIHSLRDEDKQRVLEALELYSIDIGVVADFNFIIPEDIFSKPKFGIVNIHFSLLPKYRGASPVQHALLNGDEVTGVTFQLVDKGMDTGDVIYQFEYKMQGVETTDVLYDTLFIQAAETLPVVLDGYVNNNLTPVPQNHDDATYCYSLTNQKSTYIYKEDAKIDWESMSIDQIERMVRAYYPWPIAWTTLKDMEAAKIIKLRNDWNLRVKIYRANVIDGKLNILEIQVEGKNKMNWGEFVNGYAQGKN